MVKASEVGARSALIVWRTSTVVYHSYRLIYQVAGEETKVSNVPLSSALTKRDPTFTKLTKNVLSVFIYIQ